MPEQAAHRLWQAALGQLQLQVTRPNYETWLKDTVGLHLNDDSLVVGTPNDYATTWLSTRLLPLISRTVQGIAGQPLHISFQLHNPAGNGAPHTAESSLLNGHHRPVDAASSSPPRHTHLKERFTFEHFVVGDNSRLAFASAVSITENSVDYYNPLFIYGHVGLGKTHLLHAIGHRLSSQSRPFTYITSEHFTNEFITAIARGRGDEFRRHYRYIDVLLIDDIQFLAGKDRTQEEFFYTFNDLESAGSRIVITSDNPPP
ncbi:MAG TPA: DnaA/Hda family protein, partial [Dehalococcoidia bacterium]|nr:DnaA/Hda family protein [Dehalococcoidia bacterium]